MNLPDPSLASPVLSLLTAARRRGAFGEHSDFKLEFFRLSSPARPLSFLTQHSLLISAFFPSDSPFSPFPSFHRLLRRFSVLRSLQDDRRWVTEMRQTARVGRPCESLARYTFLLSDATMFFQHLRNRLSTVINEYFIRSNIAECCFY